MARCCDATWRDAARRRTVAVLAIGSGLATPATNTLLSRITSRDDQGGVMGINQSLGALTRATNVESLFGQRNPLRACLQTGKPILISNLDEDEEWRDVSLLTSLRAKAVICLPVLVEGKVVAAMLAITPEAVPDFNDEDRQVYLQISQQTSVILQNISLLNQTR